MNKKGFTLVELLAVIVILSVIAIITVPIIGNVIEESKKKALEQSAYGLVEAADYLAINSNELEHFTFTKDGVESITNNKLDYKGKIDATGDLYIDETGDISLCLKNDKYYVYKNYNGGIIVGNIENNLGCIAGYDAITNKYVAMLDNGSGVVSNVYTKDEIDNMINPIISNLTELNTNIGDMDDLETEADTLVGAINGVNQKFDWLIQNGFMPDPNEGSVRYLYNNGNEYLSITGGFEGRAIGKRDLVSSYIRNVPTITKTTVLTGTMTGTSSQAYVGSIVTKKMIDLTNYNYLKILGKISATHAGGNFVRVFLATSNQDGHITSVDNYITTTTDSTLSINISSLTGAYYLIIEVFSDSSQSAIIKSIWLE